MLDRTPGLKDLKISSTMAYYGSYENEYISDDDVTHTNRELLLPSFEAIFHPHSTFYPNSPSQEEFSHGSNSSSYRNEAADFTGRAQNDESGLLTDTGEAYEGRQLPHIGSGNWPSDYFLLSGRSWGDLFFHGYGNCDSVLEETEDEYRQSEEQYDSYGEDTDEQPTWGYNPWSGSGYKEEHDPSDYGRQEPNLTYQDELGLCELVFGYWPCLYQKDQKSSDEEGMNEQRHGWSRTADYVFGSPFVQ